MNFNPYDVRQHERDAVAETEQEAEDPVLRGFTLTPSDDPFVFAELFCRDCDEVIAEVSPGETLAEQITCAERHHRRRHPEEP